MRGSAVVWNDPIFRRLFESYLTEIQSNLGLRAQTDRQKVETELARSGLSSSGIGIIKRQLAYAGPIIVEAMSQSLDGFDRACADLGMEPDESDCDSLREFLEPLLVTRCRSVTSSLATGPGRRDAPALRVEETVRQLEGRARSELLRGVERRKLMSRNRARQAVPGMRERVGELISAINRHANRSLRSSIFQITEPKALLDLGKAPVTESDLTHSIQSLGILLDQLNHSALTAALEPSGKAMPAGSINRLEAFLREKYGHTPEAAIGVLRDLGRLRSGYPAHPLRPEVEDAARRLSISLEGTEPTRIWIAVMEHLLGALRELSVFLEAASPAKPKSTP